MLKINMEFRKGILFVRLKGHLTKNTVTKLNKNVIELVLKNGIRNTVVNLNELKTIDIKGINALFYLYELSNKYSGVSMICGLENEIINSKIKKSRLLKYMFKTNSEIDALRYIES